MENINTDFILTEAEEEHLSAVKNVVSHIGELTKVGGFFDQNKIGYIKVFFKEPIKDKDGILYEEKARIHSFSIWDHNRKFIADRDIKNEVTKNLRIFEALYQNHLEHPKNGQALIFFIDLSTNEKYIYSHLCSDKFRSKIFAIKLSDELTSKDVVSKKIKI